MMIEDIFIDQETEVMNLPKIINLPEANWETQRFIKFYLSL